MSPSSFLEEGQWEGGLEATAQTSKEGLTAGVASPGVGGGRTVLYSYLR